MPRVSKAAAGRNRQLIEKESSRLFREQGLKVSLADVMSAAGLTHGGFYGHFKSKDDLIAIACANAFEESAERWSQLADTRADIRDKRLVIVESYLSMSNIHHRGSGCPLASLATDVSREQEDKAVRQAFHHGMEKMLEIFDGGEAERARALVNMSTMVGALILARATSGYPVASDIISLAKARLTDDIKAGASSEKE